MFEALGRVMYRRRRWVVALTLAFVVFAGVWGTGVFGAMTGGGFEDPDSESSRAAEVAAQAFGRDSADVVVLYRTIELTPAEWPPSDLVVLASASAARAYGRVGAAAPAVSIGPETTRAARGVGVEVVAEARTSDVDGLVEAVGRALAGP